MLIKEGECGVRWFLLPAAAILLPGIDCFCFRLGVAHSFWWFLPIYFIVLAVYLRLTTEGLYYQIGIRSVFLGGTFSMGVYVGLFCSIQWRLFGVYMCVMSFFHFSEFLAIAWCNPKTLSISSFVLNHSTHYNIAAVASWLEFALEVYFVPGIKRYPVVSFVGFLLCVFGEGLRKCAMITGSTNFNHIVQTEKADDHQLVTHGIYSVFRHPSYVGWFYWSIGTQVLLLNPVCSLGYAVVSWRFFRERVSHEELTLLHFFGRSYVEYQKAVGTGLPGIRGFLVDE